MKKQTNMSTKTVKKAYRQGTFTYKTKIEYKNISCNTVMAGCIRTMVMLIDVIECTQTIVQEQISQNMNKVKILSSVDLHLLFLFSALSKKKDKNINYSLQYFQPANNQP